MNWYPNDYRPTLWGALSQMASVSRSIWRDYRDCARSARRRRRVRRHAARQYFGPPKNCAWWRDWTMILVAILIVVAVVLIARHSNLPFQVLP